MFAQQLVNGLMLGGAYALVAIGYTLIFGVLNLLHLAHGEVFMVGAYVGLALALAGFSPWVTLAGAMLAAAVLGVVVERVAFRPVRNRGSHVTPLITTIAVGLVLQHVVVKIFGAEPVAFRAPFAAASPHLGPATPPTPQLLSLAPSVALLPFPDLFLRPPRRAMATAGPAGTPPAPGSSAAEARVLSDHAVSILIFAGIDVIMALSFFLPASAGQLSAGQGGFMALGAYTSAYLTVHHQTPFPLALAAGGLVGGLVGLAVGFPALRLRGLYLVLVTFGFGEMVRVLFLNAPAFGGPGGFAGIPPETTIWHVLGLLIVLVYFFTRLSGSRMGRAFAALRDDEAAAEALRVNSTYVKLAAFAAGCVSAA